MMLVFEKSLALCGQVESADVRLLGIACVARSHWRSISVLVYFAHEVLHSSGAEAIVPQTVQLEVRADDERVRVEVLGDVAGGHARPNNNRNLHRSAHIYHNNAKTCHNDLCL